jgi:hypothetical protein
MKNAGTFVNIANPKNVPESRIRTMFLSALSSLLFLLLSVFDRPFFVFVYNANNIEDKRKGIRILSSTIILTSQLRGITANRTDAINATFLLYLNSAIL